MTIPAKYAPLVFSALLSAIMVCVVSGFVLLSTQGLEPGFFKQWAQSIITTWPIAFPTVAVVAPLVRKAVAKITG